MRDKETPVSSQGYKTFFLLATMNRNNKLERLSQASLSSLVSISPTFYEQLLRQNPFAKKLQTKILSTQKLRKEHWYDCQFHQYFTSSFFIQKLFTQPLCAYNLGF
jgi:hypothetical protein